MKLKVNQEPLQKKCQQTQSNSTGTKLKLNQHTQKTDGFKREKVMLKKNPTGKTRSTKQQIRT